MKARLVVALALVASMSGRAAGGPPPAQAQAEADGIRTLLHQLERLIQAGDAPGYGALLTQSADGNDAAEFASTEFAPGASRVVLKERDREPLAGTLPGAGYRLSIDAFTEFGAKGRSATWTMDVKRSGSGGASTWRIDSQQRLAFVDNLYRLSLNNAKQYDARNLTFSFEDLDLALSEGTLFVSDTDQGATGIVALGRGELRFHPSPEVEKGQLKIFCGSETLQTRFDAIFLRVNPQEADNLLELDRLTKRPVVDQRDLRRADEIFRDEVARSYAIDLSDLSRELWSLLPASGDLVAEIRTAKYETLTYARSGAEAEDLSFFDRKRRKNINVYTSRDKLERRGRAYNEDDLVAYDVLDYDIETTFTPDRQWIDGRARLQLRVQAAALSSLTLRLAEPLVVQSIVSDRFGRLSGFRVRNQNSIVVNLPATMLRDDEMAVSVTYAGRLEPQREDSEAAGQGQGPPPEEQIILQPERSFLYSNRSYWYPQATVNDYATARLRVTVPLAFDCVASGDLAEGFPMIVGGKDSGAMRKVYEFTTSQPLRYLAFVVSRFTRAEAPAAGPAASFNRVMANPRQVRKGRELGDRARDIAVFYESIIGDYPFPSFTLAVVESDLPGGHSPGYFAILNQPLPTSPLVWRNDPASFDDFPEFFLAHELAHQWWGQAVGWRNYHEQWLSEGFAQYFAALYAQHYRGEERFASMLRQFRRWGIQQSDDGPIYLGYRLGHIRGDSRIFRALVYNKSAAVLHMLRRLVGDEEFFRGVRRFYDAARFRKAGTDDFRAAMEAEAGYSLERFFDRWIYGSTIPRIRFTFRTDAQAGGSNVVLRVEQTGPEIFDFPLTVILQFADRRESQVVIKVTDRVAELSVPVMGTLRRAEISRDDGTLVDVIKN